MRYVEIAKGGTLSKIAKQEGISLKAILFTNANLDPRRIQIGQKIAIPETEDDLLASAQTHIKRIRQTIDKKPNREVGNEPKRKCGKCFCNRDFTVEEMKKIVKDLRKSENLHSKLLWHPRYSSGISPSDKSYETMTKELNRIMKKYHINSCIRKIHFLAQIYHETDRFRAMTEYTSKYTKRYDPYRGRGLVHLTHKKTYEKFSKYMNDGNIIRSPEIVATNIKYAFEAAGWYWTNIGNVTATGENINKVADRDNTLRVSQCINGKVRHPNGLEERIKYVKELKRIFKYEKYH